MVADQHIADPVKTGITQRTTSTEHGKRALLDGAVCSFALHLTGKANSDPNLIAQSRTIYGLALNELQAALRHPSEWKASETLCATILLCYFELFAGTAAPDTWLQHAKGIGTLIEQRGPAAHAEGWDAAMLLSCRGILIVGDMFYPGKDQLFLSRPAWKQVMLDGGRHLIYAADAPASHIRVGDGFLSNLAQLSPVLHSGYLLREALKAGISIEPNKVSALSHMAAVNHARWTQWYDDFDTLEFPRPVEVTPTDPVDSLFETLLEFQSPAAGSLLMGYWASMLILEETLVQCGTPRAESVTRYFVEQILRSLESVGRGTMGPYRVGYAVRIVYEFATAEEQRWIGRMLDKFSQGYAAVDKKTYPKPRDDDTEVTRTTAQSGAMGQGNSW
ncbi:hypothetical protein FHETE_8397 [Fusarium heterosporum]|uniref:Uncharacterized protein n=1 Tax=Fusarium heterosporum TaxID=42747 RepID=A0A8H5SYV5_FUSHE|nr:hypothetical protein FHETE_8397 [Fusarium heterosporum]